MKTEMETNRVLWNELTPVHLKGSETYPIEEFRNGKNVLNEIEMEEIGDVKGKKLLHLQCHFGMDTLSWKRLGAIVTGVDISENAIDAARALASDLHLDARFIRANVLDFANKLNEDFDIVFASYGALYWIPDIRKWFKVAAGYLKNGGILYVIDGHPFYHWLNRDEKETDITRFGFSYFDRSTQRYDDAPDYADESYTQTVPEYGWHFTVGDLINAAVSAGLIIESFNEFPSFKIEKDGNAWKPIGDNKNFPVMFSLKAKKEKK